MSRNYFNSRKARITKEGLTIEDFKEHLREICDEDYNGNNGEECFIEVIDGNNNAIKKSRFQAKWDELLDKNMLTVLPKVSIAKSVLEEAYSYSNYYEDSMIEAIETEKEIIVIVAYMYCN